MKGGCVAEMTVAVSPEEFDAAIGKVYAKNRSQMAIPGFRKGKAPRSIVEKLYGASVFHNDALEMLLPDVAICAEEKSGLRFIDTPRLKAINTKDSDGGADFTLSVSYFPEVALGQYKGLTAPMPEVEIPSSMVDAEVETIRVRNARIEKTDCPVKDGDIVLVDIEGLIDGEPFEGSHADNFELTVGSGRLIPGFEEKLLGMATGQERVIDLVFPEDYKEELAGKPVVFKVRLREAKEKILPDLDDEFAKDVSEFDTLDEYRDAIKDRLQKAQQEEAEAAFVNALLDQVMDSTDVELPGVLVEEQMDGAVNNILRQVSAHGMNLDDYLNATNLTPEQLRENTRADSERQTKAILVLGKIAELECIEVSEEDIEDEYAKTAGIHGMEIEKLKESLSKERVSLEIQLRRATKIVLDSAQTQ